MITRPPAPEPPPAGPRPERGRAPVLAPIIALLGLVLIAGGSLWSATVLGVFDPAGTVSATPTPTALTTALPPTDPPRPTGVPGVTGVPGASATPVPTDEPTAAPTDTPEPTPPPTILITPPPNETAKITGTILFAKEGNIWAAREDGSYAPLSGKGTDSSPTWSRDGSRIYFVQTTEKSQDPPKTNCFGGSRNTFELTDIMSMNANGKDRTKIFQSLFPKSGGFWATTAIQPDISPDGKTIVLVSDLGVVPCGITDLNSVVLSTMTINGKNLKGLGVRTINDLGHNDPEWSPNGKSIAFTFDDKDGPIGAPKIGILTYGKKEPLLLKKGYANPSWSPDGRYIVCERTTGVGRDVVVIDPKNGAEVARLTRDGDSFAPVFSPNGNQIAYLHRVGLSIDLRVITLDTSNSLTMIADQPLTQDGHVDAESPPAWFIPEAERTLPVVTPAPEASTAPEVSPTE